VTAPLTGSKTQMIILLLCEGEMPKVEGIDYNIQLVILSKAKNPLMLICHHEHSEKSRKIYNK
jgi:hypothetical protein